MRRIECLWIKQTSKAFWCSSNSVHIKIKDALIKEQLWQQQRQLSMRLNAPLELRQQSSSTQHLTPLLLRNYQKWRHQKSVSTNSENWILSYPKFYNLLLLPKGSLLSLILSGLGDTTRFSPQPRLLHQSHSHTYSALPRTEQSLYSGHPKHGRHFLSCPCTHHPGAPSSWADHTLGCLLVFCHVLI